MSRVKGTRRPANLARLASPVRLNSETGRTGYVAASTIGFKACDAWPESPLQPPRATEAIASSNCPPGPRIRCCVHAILRVCLTRQPGPDLYHRSVEVGKCTKPARTATSKMTTSSFFFPITMKRESIRRRWRTSATDIGMLRKIEQEHRIWRRPPAMRNTKAQRGQRQPSPSPQLLCGVTPHHRLGVHTST